MTSSSSESVEEEPKNAERKHKMGLIGATSYVVGSIVGSGIFITPTSILRQTNSVGLSLIVWTLASVISTLGAFCYVELGTSIRISGGDFAYLSFMKWYPLAFTFMCIMTIINYPATIAIQVTTFSEYVFRGCSIELEPQNEYWAKKLMEFSLLWLLMFLNFFSLKTFVSRFQVVATLAKVVAAATIIGCGLYYLIVEGKYENLQNPFDGTIFSVDSFTKALFAGLFSYDGWDVLNAAAEEVEEPRRTMPLAITIGMISVAIIYLAMNISYFVLLSVPELLSTPAVAMIFAEKALGRAAFIVPLLVAILLIGSLNGVMFKASRCLQAVSKLGYLPTCISGLNPIGESPRVALFLQVLLAMSMTFMGDLDTLINYASFARWSQRAITMGALIWIKFRLIPVHPRGIKVPLVLPFIFGCVCTSMIVANTIEDFWQAAVGLGCLLAAYTVYMVFVSKRTLYSLEWYRKSIQAVDEQTTKVAQIIFNVIPETERRECSVLAMIDIDAQPSDKTSERTSKSTKEE